MPGAIHMPPATMKGDIVATTTAEQAVVRAAGVAMTIDGRNVKAERTFEVLNPATGRHLADAPDCTRSQVDAVMGGASRAFRTWRLDDAARRAAMLVAAAELEQTATDLALILTAEQGK